MFLRILKLLRKKKNKKEVKEIKGSEHISEHIYDTITREYCIAPNVLDDCSS